jgi:hypothetical protein
MSRSYVTYGAETPTAIPMISLIQECLQSVRGIKAVISRWVAQARHCKLHFVISRLAWCRKGPLKIMRCNVRCAEISL